MKLKGFKRRLGKVFECWRPEPERNQPYEVARSETVVLQNVAKMEQMSPPIEECAGLNASVCQPSLALRDGEVHHFVDDHTFDPPLCSTKIEEGGHGRSKHDGSFSRNRRPWSNKKQYVLPSPSFSDFGDHDVLTLPDSDVSAEPKLTRMDVKEELAAEFAEKDRNAANSKEDALSVVSEEKADSVPYDYTTDDQLSADEEFATPVANSGDSPVFSTSNSSIITKVDAPSPPLFNTEGEIQPSGPTKGFSTDDSVQKDPEVRSSEIELDVHGVHVSGRFTVEAIACEGNFAEPENVDIQLKNGGDAVVMFRAGGGSELETSEDQRYKYGNPTVVGITSPRMAAEQSLSIGSSMVIFTESP